MRRVTVIRIVLLSLTLVSTALATITFATVLFHNSVNALDLIQLILFAGLFALVAFSFWSVLAGLWFAPKRREASPSKQVGQAAECAENADAPGRVAILVPVYQEDPARVFAGVEATVRELHDSAAFGRYDLFVLSDTRCAETWIAEELCWQAVVRRTDGSGVGVYYRRRKENKARKSGNVEDFVTRFGGAYEHMIVYDADSLMAGQTIHELIDRMDADPKLGILQVPPRPVNRTSLFARLQQYAAAIYGPIFGTGLRIWTDDDGNYWGHNAAIRVKPFADHCGLPVLPGRAPLGGEILSHDFVEAALMRRAGFKVRLADDLDGSYEEPPTTLIDFAKRDQRWCQGNLQHSGLIARKGLHPVSRAHLVMGILSFCAAPLWAVFLLFGLLGFILDTYLRDQSPDLLAMPIRTLAVFSVTMLMLIVPKLIGTFRADLDEPGRHGGPFALFVSTLIEIAASIVIAPIFMAFHTRFVLTTLAGRSVQWNAQQRTEVGTGLHDAVHAHGAQTIVGVALALVSYHFAPGLFWWLSPVFVGLIFSIPISMIISNRKLGELAQRAGLLLIPEEVKVPRVITRLHDAEPHYVALVQSIRDTDPITHLLHDADLLDLHLRVLRANHEYDDSPTQPSEREVGLAYHGGTRYLTADDRERLLRDPASLQLLQSRLLTGTAGNN